MYKIGQSRDIHELVFDNNKKDSITLGLVNIDTNHHIKAISDGDILIHVIVESIIGALSLGDLGDHFSENVNLNDKLNGLKMLKYIKNILKENNFLIVNIDSLIIYDHVRLSTLKNTMRVLITKELGIELNQLNIKATRTENSNTSFIEAESVVLLKQIDN